MTASAPSRGGDSTLATKCMDFCNALASQGLAFSFTLSVGPDFSFSLDARERKQAAKVLTAEVKKKLSPSQVRRNARRRQEFLKRKAETNGKEQVVEAKTLKCDQCDKQFKSESGLKIHMGKSHKNVNTTPERMRQQPASPTTKPTSPLSDARREEVGEEKEEPVSPLQPSPSPPIERCKNCDTPLNDHWCCASDKMLCPDCCSDRLEVCDKYL